MMGILYGEILFLSRGLQKLASLQALLPQRRPLARSRRRHKQGTGRALAKARSEQRREAHALAHDGLQLVGIEQEQFGAGQGVFIERHADQDAVIGR